MKSGFAAFVVAGVGLVAGLGVSGPNGVPEQQQVRWPAPRKQAPVSLRLLWRSDQVKNDASALLYPSDIQFSAAGLLVFDYGEMTIVGLNSANGRRYFSSGRRGAGPGEFNGPVWFFGTYGKPMAVQFSSSRVTSVSSKGELSGVPVSRSGRWVTGCSWRDGTLLFQASSFGEHDYFVSTTGPQAATVDSLSHPWERLRKCPSLPGRQD